MFESAVIKIRKPDTIEWNSPKFISLVKEDDYNNVFTIKKGAETFLYKELDMKPNTSKEVYKLSDDIWCKLINLQRQKATEQAKPFDMESDNTIYLTDDNNNLVDMFIINNEEELVEFKKSLNKYVMDITTDEKTRKFFTDGKDDTLKLVCYDRDADIVNDEYTPVVLMELNTSKSIYNVYTGILIYKTFTFIPSFTPFYQDKRISTFIYNFNLDKALEISEQSADELYHTYTQLLENDLEVSVREMVSMLKQLGYKLTLKDDNRIDEITNLNDEEANKQIQDFFNTFEMVTNETATDILSLSDLQKIFRYNKLTFMDLLKILSKEYLTYEGSKITAEILGTIIIDVYSKKTDKNQSDLIKQQIK